MKASFLSILFLFISVQLIGQTYEELIDNSISGKDITERIPSLAVLQNVAQSNSPLLKIHDANIVISQLKMNSEKREWMRNLGFEAGAKYGLFDNLIIKEDLGIGEVATNTTEQTRYNLGVFLKIPLSLIVDKSAVKLASAERDIELLERQSTISELNKLVIVQYGNLIKAYRNLVILNNTVEVYRVQMAKAEKEFSNGKISIDEFARFSDMLSRTSLNLEDFKIEFFIAHKLLEETVGMKIKIED
jgi:outer membrane protein TolC